MLYVGKTADPNQNPSQTVSFCNAAGIELTFEHEKDDLYNWQQLNQPDIIFFIGYSHVVKTTRLTDVKWGIYNVHFGLLPQFRGPAPVFWQLRNGLKEIGLVIHRLIDKLDSGPVIWQYKTLNEPHFSYDYVHQLFGNLYVKGILQILDSISAGKRLPEIEQDECKAAYYERPQLKDIMISWDTMEAKEITDVIKACNSWNMGALTLINGSELKILDATVTISNKMYHTPGTIVLNNNFGFGVACKGGKLLNINYFKINDCYAPGRFAGKYGLNTGQRFINYAEYLNPVKMETE